MRALCPLGSESEGFAHLQAQFIRRSGGDRDFRGRGRGFPLRVLQREERIGEEGREEEGLSLVVSLAHEGVLRGDADGCDSRNLLDLRGHRGELLRNAFGGRFLGVIVAGGVDGDKCCRASVGLANASGERRGRRVREEQGHDDESGGNCDGEAG